MRLTPKEERMSVLDVRLRWLDHVKLAVGSHPSGPNGAACVMEAVSYVAGEPWSDHPACASPIITAFLIRWNDSMNETDRQMLKPYIPRLVGTRTSAQDEEIRAWLLTDWLARECAPAWLRLAGLTAQAEMLEGLAPVLSSDAARAAQGSLYQARKDSVAAWAAPRDAAGAAARAAAWDAAGDAAWDAARAAAWDATPPAAWDAARAATGDAAWDAAWDAARAATGDAARAALRPTVEVLQASALLLLERWCSGS